MLESIWPWITQQFTQNEIFAGLVGGSLFAGALYSLRSIPGRAWRLFLLQGTSEMVVYNDDEAFDWLNEWLACHAYAKRARRLKLSTFGAEGGAPVSVGDERNHWTLAPGPGQHVFFHKGKLLWLTRERGEASESGGGRKPRETLVIRVFSRDTCHLRALIAEADQTRVGEHRTDVYVFDDYWRRVARKLPRAIDSVVLPQGQIDRIVADAEWFVGAASWYQERGVPYRRGYMFSGPPGCGKTSLVVALASHLLRPIYSLNLGGVSDDNQLFAALGGVPTNAVLLIEDVDAATATKSRTKQPAKDENQPPGVTLSGMLNALDGVASTDGRILVMTSNYPEKLDPALVRPGRVDVREHIGLAGPAEAKTLFLRFFPGIFHLAKEIGNADGLEMSGAELQAIYMRHNKSPGKAKAEVIGR